VDYVVNADALEDGAGTGPVNTWCEDYPATESYLPSQITDMNPPETAMCMDGYEGNDGGWACEWYTARPTSATVGPWYGGFHNNGMNIGFWDGHAAWMSAALLFTDWYGHSLPAPQTQQPGVRTAGFGPNLWWTANNEQ
jgi:prepilin-type processing-associated H-X9-DG protein